MFAGFAAAEVVLLKNGSVVSGEVRQEPSGVVVRVARGGEIRLRESIVAVVRPTLADVYAWLRSRPLASTGAEGHIELAEWCVRNGLWPEASRELLEARQHAPDSERIALLERRLTLLSSAPSKDPADAAPSSEPVRQVGYEADAESEPPPQLDVPDAAFEQFARRIQPLLLNNCTNGGCHRGGGPGGGFELDRRLLHGYGDRRSTEHNLRVVLAAIDAESPADSFLLVAARGPHAGVTPLRGRRREEWIKRLEGWVGEIAAAQPAAAPDVPTNVDLAVQQAAFETTNEEASAPLDDGEDGLTTGRVVRGSRLRPTNVRDEFDPEIFNRRHRTPEDDLPLEVAAE